MTRIINFIKRYLLKHPLYVISYVSTYFLKGFAFNEHFYTKEEIKNFVLNGKSIIRLGDGEINLLLDLKNHYHKFSPKLKNMIREIISGYSFESSYVLSIPRFINFRNEELQKIGKLNVWMPLKTMFFLVFPKKISYMDAHNFYYDNYFEDVISPIIKNKKIILITKKETIEKQKNSNYIPWENISYIETPEANAIDFYEDIKLSLNKELLNYKKGEVVLLVAMGPVGKYLIFEYGNIGYQGIDIGVAIENIFTGESIQHLI